MVDILNLDELNALFAERKRIEETEQMKLARAKRDQQIENRKAEIRKKEWQRWVPGWGIVCFIKDTLTGKWAGYGKNKYFVSNDSLRSDIYGMPSCLANITYNLLAPSCIVSGVGKALEYFSK